MALVDTGAEASVIHGNPDKIKGNIVPLIGLGGQMLVGKGVTLPLKIGNQPIRNYSVVVAPAREWIIGMDILAGMTLHLKHGRFCFGINRIHTILVGNVKMTPFPIPEATQVVSQKQYRLPGGQKEITDTIKEYLEAGVLKTCTTRWNNPLWPVKKSDGSWRMTVDYRALNKHTPPLTSAVPDVITIVERVQHHSGTWYAVIDLANAFFTIPIPEDKMEQFAFTWEGRQYTFTRLPQGYLHSPTICHRIVAENLSTLKIPSGILLSHYIDDIMIQGNTKEEVEQLLPLLITHMKNHGWEINPAKVQGSAQSVKFLGIIWNRGEREITTKAKEKIARFPIPQNKTDAQRYIGLFGFWRHHIPHLGQILQPMYRCTRKKEQFEWGPDQQQSFELAKEAIQQAVSLGKMLCLRLNIKKFELFALKDCSFHRWYSSKRLITYLGVVIDKNQPLIRSLNFTTLLDSESNLLSYADFLHLYGLPVPPKEYAMVFDAVPAGVVMLLKGSVVGDWAPLPLEPAVTSVGRICFWRMKKNNNGDIRPLSLKDKTHTPDAIVNWNNLFYDLDWEKIWTLPSKFLLTNKVKEVSFKIIHRFYPTKSFLKRYKKDIDEP
nr:uncharacterized protein LOC129159926 [Nothobranchius furzeri]